MYYPFFAAFMILSALIAVPTVSLGSFALLEGFPRIRLGQGAGIVAASGWIFGMFTRKGPAEDEQYALLSLFLIVLIFFGFWRHEFRLLMDRRDDEFAGRYDKVGWFLMLTLAAPAGVWIFRSYRKRRWASPGVEARPEPARPSRATAGVG